jgi:sugar phosphate permease
MTPRSSPPRVFYGWFVIAALSTILFLSAGLGFYSLGVFITPFEEEFGWSRGQISIGIALATITSGLLGPAVGLAVERVGARRVLGTGAVGMAICFALLGLTWCLPYLYAMFALMAAWRAGIMIVPVSHVVTNWFQRRRGLAIGAAVTGIGFGGLVMAPLSKVLISSMGWRPTFFILGLVIVAVALPLILVVIRERPSDRGLHPDGLTPTDPPLQPQLASTPRPGPAIEVWPVGQAIRTRAFILATAATSLGFASMGAVLLHTSPFMEDRGLAPELAGLVLGFVAGMGILGKVGSGYVSDRIAPPLVLATVFLMETVGLVVLIATTSIVGVVAFVLIFGYSMGAIVALQPLVVVHYFGAGSVATTLGAMTAFSAVFNALGPVFAGVMHDWLGNYTLAYLIFAGVNCFAAFLVLLIRPPRVGERAELSALRSPAGVT